MQFTTVSGAAVLLALAPTVMSVGTAHVVNNCGFDVYYASVVQSVASSMQLLPSGGFSEVYSLPDVGVSIKLAPSISTTVTQFEFTWADGKINYDISNINGDPFSAYGMTLTPSMAGDSAYPTCEVISCPAGVVPCTAAYNEPNDTRTMVCDQASDLTMTLCPNGSGAVASSSSTTRSVSTSSSSSASASVAAATTTASTAVPATATSTAAASTSTGWHGHNRYHARHLPTK